MLSGQAVVVPVGAPFAVRLSLGEHMQGPDIIFTDGTIYTVDDEHPRAEAVAVRDGKFMQVDSAGDIERLAGPRTEVVDLGGAFAMPGFIDCHVHPAQPYLHEEGGALLFPVSFGRQQIADTVAGYLRRNPDVPYVIGERWALELFPTSQAETQELYLGYRNRTAVNGKEKVYGSIP